ncbi:PilC/PilY family type IV pilus protein [Dyella sp. EPa41]|uniref:pilus assembly protein n=1 Tax=Dyella sp. EPa41 TaxID=1561194 RepID=UPI001915E901|nr:PilC/PilY family type IV pilus protein [Dyella sp. EPa41]
MNITSRLRSTAATFAGRLVYTSLLVLGLGIASQPAQAAGTSVTIDKGPLIVQASLPPNIMLMLDDSGSMAWDYMPDWGYLVDQTDDGVRNSANNGTYYNSAVSYTPPPKADGSSSYANSPGLTNAYADGFLDQTATDITRYKGQVNYFVTLSVASYTYAPTLTCSNGDSLVSTGTHAGQCAHSGWSGTTYYAPTQNCPNYSTDSLNSSGQCVSTKRNFFTYATGTPVKNGTYTQHYVGTTGTCATITSSTTKALCDDNTTTQQNVANWFSYYRTRILMAKSGLMTAFATIDPTYRVGFGSINNRNVTDIKATGNYTSAYNNTMATVQPFGSGASSTQKSNFWTWVNDITPNNSTPLRMALDSVGQYYQSGQPWQTDTTDSSSGELACRASYTILTTDGFWNEDDSLVTGIGDTDGVAGTKITGPNSQAYTYSPALPYADSGQLTNVYGPGTVNYSQSASSNTDCQNQYKAATGSTSGYQTSYYSSKRGTCKFSYTGSVVTSPAVTYSNTLADVAMKYWETDLRPSTDNEVPVNNEDPAFWQHMTTFTMGLGFTPLYSDQKTAIPMDQVFAWANGDSTKAISGFVWPLPTNANQGSINNIADLAHAAVNGHGGFYSASSPQAFASGLKDALKRASERVGTGASLAANSTQLQTGTVAYQANYWTAKWKGDLKALAINSTTGAISATATWTASNALPAAASRNIYTYTGSSYIAFKNDSSGSPPALSSSQLSALASSATAQADMVNYLRGDSSKDQKHGGSFRTRDTPIGDIISSQPVYVGAPTANQFINQTFTGSTAFAKYASDNASRTGLIYVAANDGMLHAFYASDVKKADGTITNAGGSEAFAYLPGAVLSSSVGITDLASPDYGGTVSHEYFNDGELTVADVYIGTAWKTVLVGTTGRGLAKAVYAFDVTDPANIKFLWERSSGDSNSDGNGKYIGQMTGKPVIAQTSDGTWSVLMGNGYNSTAGVAALLQFNLSDGTLSVHATTDTTGLAAPAVWIDPVNNGVSTMAYAGDLDGNLWSFTINKTSKDSSGNTVLTATPSSSGTKLFTAKDSGNKAQPITGGILAGKDSQTGNVWVFFGTGKYLTQSDLKDTSTQTWYGLIVSSTDSTNHPAIDSSKDRTALASRSITAETSASGNTLAARSITTTTDATSLTGKSGWYIDLLQPVAGGGTNAQGERMVTPNQFQGNLLLGTTRIPKATDLCNPSGTGWIMAIDPFTGTNPNMDFFDVNGDGSTNASDRVNGAPAAGVGFGSLPNNPIFVGGSMLVSFDNGTNSSIQTSGATSKTQRVSWRELINQ